jgi:glutamyl-Q tRNA(Asp) synthetase
VRVLGSFGLAPDGEVVRQSARTALYDRLFEGLRRAGLVYPCRCSRKEIASAASAPHGPEGPRYPGTCRSGIPATEARAWRFRAPEGAVDFADGVFGPISQDVSAEIGDFIVRRERPERTYAYQFAVVADDAEQGITQVVRGADLLDSTPRQILLYRALGSDPPRFAHVPILVTSEGEKRSKRLGREDLGKASASQRREILARILGLLGQEPTLESALSSFDPSHIPRKREIEAG